jgi:hypothetical protein
MPAVGKRKSPDSTAPALVPSPSPQALTRPQMVSFLSDVSSAAASQTATVAGLQAIVQDLLAVVRSLVFAESSSPPVCLPVPEAAPAATTPVLPSAPPQAPFPVAPPVLHALRHGPFSRPPIAPRTYAATLRSNLESAPADKRARIAVSFLSARPPAATRLRHHSERLHPEFAAKVAEVSSIFVRFRNKSSYADMRRCLWALDPSLEPSPGCPSALLSVSYAGPITELVLATSSARQSLVAALQSHGLEIVEGFDPTLPLSPAKWQDESARAVATQAYLQRMLRGINSTQNVLLATYLYRRVPGLTSALDKALFPVRPLLSTPPPVGGGSA